LIIIIAITIHGHILGIKASSEFQLNLIQGFSKFTIPSDLFLNWYNRRGAGLVIIILNTVAITYTSINFILS